MRIAVLVKQIPVAEHLRFVDGRIVRDGVDLEANAYCRRANAKAVELAGEREDDPVPGEVVVFTLGPPAADDVLREMIACGADRGVHVCDPAFAGSDTLATARALTAAIVAEGPFDLVLCGLNSLDADTGQVGPEIAALLGWPFVAGARELRVAARSFAATTETDDGFADVVGPLPAVISTAERLTEPSKAPPDQRRAVADALISRRTAADLGLRPDAVGAAGSPTWVGPSRTTESTRLRRRVTSVAEAVELLTAFTSLDDDDTARELERGSRRRRRRRRVGRRCGASSSPAGPITPSCSVSLRHLPRRSEATSSQSSPARTKQFPRGPASGHWVLIAGS